MIESEHLKLNGISHGFFTRGGGHSTGIFASLNCGLGSGDDPELVKMNRDLVARALRVGEGHVVTSHQVHSADVAEVGSVWPLEGRPKVDGLVSNTKGIALGILTADCGPVLFADETAQVIGCCHAGWKGALTGVTDRIRPSSLKPPLASVAHLRSPFVLSAANLRWRFQPQTIPSATPNVAI